ncbi:MAG: hypothetical protein JXA54_03335 [Candidatus Heimdallarchaeota archaeon]|nr:hypothetical protein [Candidatus Heimdallarchaeota archaeon]
MDQNNNISAVLVEFDSLKGPIIRKKNPTNLVIPKMGEVDNILMWIIRALDFSVRKINNQTAYAKTIMLRDPNYTRKKRQFGIAIITETTYDLKEMEEILDKIIQRCYLEGENKPYFKMLNNLLQIISKINEFTNGLFTRSTEQHQIQSIIFEDKAIQQKPLEEEIEDKETRFMLISNRLNILNKITISDNSSNKTHIVCAANKLNQINGNVGHLYQVASERLHLELDVRRMLHDGTIDSLEILLRIIEVLPSQTYLNERILVVAEFLDRLLNEEVDLEYFLPYLQYFVSMENFTITEFKTEEFEKQFENVKETHGDWIKLLSEVDLDGKGLSEFFKLTGLRREGLELLIDLLFVKIIAIF